MKGILIILLLFVSSSLFAQKLPDMGFNKVRITEPDKTILVEINPVNHTSTIKPGLFYYWYSANAIHSTQGGFSGKLLNGLYTEFYLNKNLKEQGTYKKGLKDGIWKSWNEDGTLSQAAKWRNGTVVSKASSKFWRKMNLFKRKVKRVAVDTLTKTNK